MTERDTNYFADSKTVGKGTGLGHRGGIAVGKASKLLDEFAKRSVAAVWPHVDRERLIVGLRNRLFDPDVMQQHTANVCGVVTLVRVMAFDFPFEYVSLALDLYERGSGSMRGRYTQSQRLIRASSDLKLATPPPGMDHADWIVLASIRESLNNVFNYTPDEGVFAIKAWTFPGDVEHEFRALGYTRLRVKAGIVNARGYDSLMEASHLFQSSWRVVMLISANLLADVPGGVMHFGDHWVGLNSAIVPMIGSGAPKLYPFEVWSWADRKPVADRGRPIALKTVIDRYFGFVAGQF